MKRLLAFLALALAATTAAAQPEATEPALPAPVPVVADTPAWERTLERVVPAVVVLRISSTRPFDTQPTGASTATGFVVDAERGIILTNRHVVTPGPVVAEAVFQNHEEVDVYPVYRDPVHDFGFFRYDPSKVRFMKHAELKLAPQRARVGTEIRVVGNDAGEKLSILAGTLARLDRDAPEYGRGGYNDWNTFYYQAASNTSGGSSGSPVIDRSGAVIAINAGGKRTAASSYYLPLDRIVRALEYVRRGEAVPRGTLQTVFVHKPFDEVRRLGLRPETEHAVRVGDPEAIGMLTVADVVPGGPGDGVLQPGDVLVRVEGTLGTRFLPLEAALDDRVGSEVALEIERGGEPISVTLAVGDLHEITPKEYLEAGGAGFNPLSYQQARNYGLPVQGVYVAASGYMLRRAGIPSRSIITEVGGTPTPTLRAMHDALAALADGARVPVRYFRVQIPKNRAVAVLTMDRRWHPMNLCTRDDSTGDWPCVQAPPPPPPEPVKISSTTFRDTGDRRTRKVARSLAQVRFMLPYRVDGAYGDTFIGSGLVVDAERGLVVVDRDTVPVSLGDATITFAGSVEVPAEVVYLHPEHNLAVIRYDPARLGDTPVHSAELEERRLEAGDELWLVGMSESQQIVSEKVQISRVETSSLPQTAPPRFREANVELVTLTRASTTVGGVLVDKSGRVVAVWSSFSAQGPDGPRAFFAGIPSALIDDIVTPLREDRPVEWRSIGAELQPISLAEARSRGLSEESARILEEHDSSQRRVLSVRLLAADVAAAHLLHEGDLLLSIDDVPVTRVRDVERAVQGAERVRLSLLRDGAQLDVDVPTQALSGRGTDRAVLWAGALLQRPHRAIAVQHGLPREGLYVAWYAWGSPAHRYGLGATRRIEAVDGKPTPDLDSFLATMEGKGDRAPVRLRTVDLEGKPDVITLKLDERYWPVSELLRNGAGWERIER